MNRLSRSLVALLASGLILFAAPAGPMTSLAQPRTPCDQLQARLGQIQDEEAQVRLDLETVGESQDTALLGPMLDRLEGVLADTEALLQRMDECSRSPIPSQAD
jgi:hypothetical protein